MKVLDEINDQQTAMTIKLTKEKKREKKLREDLLVSSKTCCVVLMYICVDQNARMVILTVQAYMYLLNSLTKNIDIDLPSAIIIIILGNRKRDRKSKKGNRKWG